jgi:hypothetical protein
MSDFNKRSLDVSSLLPVRIRDKTLSLLIKNLFNRFLTKNETTPFFGYVGSKTLASEQDVYVTHETLDREINALQPAIYVKHATTERAFTWNDVLQKLLVLGVDIDKINEWGAIKSFNWVPPIDLDKFINFSEYYWLGGWVQAAIDAVRGNYDVLTGVGQTTAGLSTRLGTVLFDASYISSTDETWTVTFTSPTTFTVVGSNHGSEPNGAVNTSGTSYVGNVISFFLTAGTFATGNKIVFKSHDATDYYTNIFYNATAALNLLNASKTLEFQSHFEAINPTYSPEYYVIKRKANQDMIGWTRWSIQNLWVHKSDVDEFLATVTAPILDKSLLVQANRPIIEYDNDIQLNSHLTADGAPGDAATPSSTSYVQEKLNKNQPPLFDLYYVDGTHAGKISPIFYYSEGNNYPVDPVIGRRLQIDEFGEFTFEQGLLVDDDANMFQAADEQQLLQYKKSGALKSMWVDGYIAEPQYVKLDDTGNFINEDKLKNFKNYYWVGLYSDLALYPAYYGTNKGQPEYTVIEAGGTSDWSKFNFWTHVSNINSDQLALFIQAQQPIIEFNKLLEGELLAAKSSFAQRPKFKLYTFNDVTDTYDVIPPAFNADDIDIIAQHYLFVPNSAIDGADGNLRVGEVANNVMLEVDGIKYVQSLKSYYFKTRDGDPAFFGSGNGAMTNLTLKSTDGVQEWYVNRDDTNPLVFTVMGSISGEVDAATVGVPYDNGAIAFTITAGNVPFGAADYFAFRFVSSYLQSVTHYAKLGAFYKTIDAPIDIVEGVSNINVIEATVADGDGIWKVPEPVFFNLNNENRKQVKQGDLYYHFASIIQAQSGLVGGALSTNNYRKLTPDHGLGGRIKQYNGQWNLILGLLNQNNITPLSILEFAKRQYASLQNKVTDYVLNAAIDDLTAGNFTVTDPNYADVLFDLFVEYNNNQNNVVVASPSSVDDNLSRLFYDSTSPIPNTIITLPMLGLADKVEPEITFDPWMGMNVLVHHDGHKTRTYTYDLETIKKYINKSYTRSNGQISAGFVTANIVPQKPFKNQFWYNTVTNELKYYNVVSDTGETPTTALVGQLSYDRLNDTLQEWNGTGWVAYIGNLSDAWTPVPNIVDTLSLRVEQELFNNTPPATWRVDPIDLRSHTDYEDQLLKQFEKFGARHNITDVLSNMYDANNPFTWNYAGVIVSPLSLYFPTWQQLYAAYYGTPRPDLYPWITVGMTQDQFETDLALYSITEFTPQMWSYVKARIGGKPLSVNPSTNELLPPYVASGKPFAAEALTNVVPAGIANRFAFGDLGPIETAWRNSIDFVYDEAKVFFKLDPVSFIDETWGYDHTTLSGSQYKYFRELNKKLRQTEFKLHGETRSIQAFNGAVTHTNYLPGFTDLISFEAEVVDRVGGYYKVTNIVTKEYAFVPIGSTYIDSSGVQFRLEDANRKGMKQGDKVIISFNTGLTSLDPTQGVANIGVATEAIAGRILDVKAIAIPASSYSFTGLNQLYVQLLREQSSNIDSAINVSILRDWTNLLSYKVAGFVNTETLSIGSDLFEFGSADYNILIKENRYLSNNWLNALRIQLVQIGTTDSDNGFTIPGKHPADDDYLRGKDWVFRVDSLNARNPRFNFYNFNTGGNFVTFKALNGDRAPNDWRRYTDVVSTQTEAAPFLIVGIQNLLNFIFGYVAKLEADGWAFNDAEDPIVDETTGRLIGWQLEVERMINSLFSSPPVGSGFLLAPFKRTVSFKTPRGVVSDLTRRDMYDAEGTQSILNVMGKEIDPSHVRVFRGDEITEIISDEPMYVVHLTTSEYEHIVLFNNYAADTNLVYDPFLGQRVSRILFNGDRQVTFNGRLSFGGQYLSDNTMRKNVEASVDGILKLYDVELLSENSNEAEHASALVGYESKNYFKDLNIPFRSSFRFWQGMLKNKGSNFSIDAFINSRRYDTSTLDEYWAFKISEYGEGRLIQDPEFKMLLDDVVPEQSRYRFLEKDEETDAENDGYDVKPYETRVYDGYLNVDPSDFEQANLDGFIKIYPDDDERWVTIDDQFQHQYFAADLVGTCLIIPTSTSAIYDVIDINGRPIIADCFEIVDESTNTRPRYRERGELQSDGTFATPLFKRINATTIQFTSGSLLNKNIRVYCYGRPNERYGPYRIINYRENVTATNGIPHWDPARGRHHPDAFKNVDMIRPTDPARYNKTNLVSGSMNYDIIRPWGEKELGKIWWNTDALDYRPYYDSKMYSINDRLSIWGAKADYSNVEVYQWITSDVSPEDYAKTISTQSDNDGSEDFKYSGEIAIKNLLVRGRKWQQRAIAWKHADNPITTKRWINNGENATSTRIRLSSIEIGSAYAILAVGRTAPLELIQGAKLSHAIYTSTTKTAAESDIATIFGESIITGEEDFVVGSTEAYEDNGIFASHVEVWEGGTDDPYFYDYSITLDDATLRDYLTDVTGLIKFSSEYNGDTDTYWIKATVDATGKSQRILVEDTPIMANTLITYRFDELGFSISAYNQFSHQDNWGDAVANNFAPNDGSAMLVRQALAAASFGNADHNVVFRSKFDIFNLMPYRHTYTLDGIEETIETQELLGFVDDVAMSWISWTDPTDISSDSSPPFNRWEPILGSYIDTGDALPLLETYIEAENAAPLTTRTNTEIKKFSYIWTPWEISLDSRKSAKYTSSASFFEDNFTLALSIVSDIRPRTRVFVNGVHLEANEWYFANHSDPTVENPVVTITKSLKLGDMIMVIVTKYLPSDTDLSFDPDSNPAKDEPLRLLQYKWDYPHVAHESYNEYGIKGQTKYYFWVKDMTSKYGNKSMPIKRIATLLDNNTDPYAIINGLKYYNQKVGKPNRFALLILRNASRYVNAADTFKLRVSANHGLRDDDVNMTLKNFHKEWVLVRERQSSRIPKKLWDSLINSACGQTAVGDALPSFRRKLYDEKHGTFTSYGLGQDQILLDKDIALETIKYTILNTKLEKFVVDSGFIPDTINFANFSVGYDDESKLDEYLADPIKTRGLLDNMWEHATAKQVNEIFFAVLSDALVVNPEMKDLFKTSFVALQVTIPVTTTNLTNTIEYY